PTSALLTGAVSARDYELYLRLYPRSLCDTCVCRGHISPVATNPRLRFRIKQFVTTRFFDSNLLDTSVRENVHPEQDITVLAAAHGLCGIGWIFVWVEWVLGRLRVRRNG